MYIFWSFAIETCGQYLRKYRYMSHYFQSFSQNVVYFNCFLLVCNSQTCVGDPLNNVLNIIDIFIGYSGEWHGVINGHSVYLPVQLGGDQCSWQPSKHIPLFTLQRISPLHFPHLFSQFCPKKSNSHSKNRSEVVKIWWHQSNHKIHLRKKCVG